MEGLYTFLVIVVFVAGTVVGSFVNVLLHRIPLTGWKSVIAGRSHCPKCKKLIPWHDLIPLLSFAFLQGKCRNCGKSISWQYPIVEFTTGILFVALFLIMGLSISFILYALLLGLLIAVFVFDLKTMIIPNVMLVPIFFLAVIIFVLTIIWPNQFTANLLEPTLKYQALLAFAPVYHPLSGPLPLATLIYGLAGSLFGAVFFAVLYVFSRGTWIGMGDVKLGAVLGLITGWPLIVVNYFFAFIIGGIFSVYLLAIKKKGSKAQIPFAPFLLVGLLITIFWGPQIWSWYIGTFI